MLLKVVTIGASVLMIAPVAVTLLTASDGSAVSSKREVILEGPFSSFAQYDRRLELRLAPAGPLTCHDKECELVVRSVASEPDGGEEVRRRISNGQTFVAVKLPASLAAAARLTVSVE